MLVAAIVFEYLVLPQIAGARKTVHLLGQVNVAWLAAGLLLEGAAIVSYAELTRTLLPDDTRPSQRKRVTESLIRCPGRGGDDDSKR